MGKCLFRQGLVCYYPDKVRTGHQGVIFKAIFKKARRGLFLLAPK